VWLSEIILQQTRVDQGLPYYERFIEAFPTVQDLADAPQDRVLKLWEGLGYYSRARNLHKAAREVAETYGGSFPGTAEGLEKLPGVGRYTAGAVASIAFNESTPLVDGNVLRVFSRLFDIGDSIDDVKTRDAVWKLADQLVPAERPGDFNQALMELGARVCAPKNPSCEECPVATLCDARKAGVQRDRPVRTQKKAPPHHELVVAAVKKRGRYLVAKRPQFGMLAGLWELPSGRVDNGETHEAALVRVMRETLGIVVKPGGLVASVKHAYSHLRVTLNVYACVLRKGCPAPTDHDEVAWLAPDEFEDRAFHKANHKFLHLL